MKKQIALYSSVLLSLSLLTGCGSNDKPDGNVVTDGEASMSILLEGRLELDETRGCQKLFVVHAVNGNGNPIPGLNVNANIIVNAKAIGNGTGTIQTTAPITLADPSKNFNASQVSIGDKLIILPTAARHHTSYLGDWDINKVEGGTLTLMGAAYNLETTDQINYVVGNESAYVPGYGIAVAHVEKPDSNGTSKTTNDDGYAYFDVIYDPSLAGHQFVVGAHSGDGYRMGAAVSGILPNCMQSPDDNTSNGSSDNNNSDNNSSSSCNGSSGSCNSASNSSCSSGGTCPNATP